MIKLGNEDKTSHETQAGQAGEETHALRRGSQESMGRGEEVTQEMIEAGYRILCQYSHWSDARLLIKTIYLKMVAEKPSAL